MMTTKIVTKALPFKNEAGFTAMPNEILRVYTKHPKFNGNTLLVYMYLLDKFNLEFRYAFPTQDQIADETFLSRQTVITAINTLINLRLINKVYNSDYGNNVYTFNKPIHDSEVFAKEFEEVGANVLKFEEKRKKDAGSREERRSKFRELVDKQYQSTN